MLHPLSSPVPSRPLASPYQAIASQHLLPPPPSQPFLQCECPTPPTRCLPQTPPHTPHTPPTHSLLPPPAPPTTSLALLAPRSRSKIDNPHPHPPPPPQSCPSARNDAAGDVIVIVKTGLTTTTSSASAAAEEEEERGVHFERSELIVRPIRLRGEPPRGLFLHVAGGAGGGGFGGRRRIGSV